MKSLEELLDHADFVNRLAMRLVGDVDRAADLSQQIWLATVENPPSSESSSQSWFSQVARNLVARLHRTESRREKRERRAARPEPVSSAAEVVERAEIRHRVVEAVLSLEEPYRSTILFRFYEDLPPRRIADIQNTPVETVRTRLKRGIEKLRERLDATHSGGRQVWLSALAPIAGLKLVAPETAVAASASVGAASTAGGLISGGLVMATKIKIGIAVVLVLSAAAVLVGTWPESGDDLEQHGRTAVVESAGLEAPAPVLTGHDSSTPEASAANDSLLAPVGMRKALDPSGLFIAGRVTEKGTEDPIRAFHFRLRRSTEGRAPSQVIVNETVCDEDGRFSYALEQGGAYLLSVHSSSHIPTALNDLAIPEDEGISDLVIELDPGLSVSGRVIEDATGDPVSGALVGTRNDTRLEPILFGFEQYCVHTYSDAAGRFELRGVRFGEQVIAAVHSEFAEGWIDIGPGKDTGEVIIRLKTGYHIYGRAQSDAGKPMEGLVISVYGEKPRFPIRRTALTASDGTYRVGPVGPGKVGVNAQPPADMTELTFGFTKEHKFAEIDDQDVEVNFGPDSDQVTWRGKLIDPTGLPVEGIEVQAVLNKEFVELPGGRIWRKAACDEVGTFEMSKLYPGRYRIHLGFPDQRSFEWGEMSFEKPGLAEHEVRLVCGAVRGVVVDGRTGARIAGKRCYVGLSHKSPFDWRYAVDNVTDGTFCIRGVHPGTYIMRASGREIPWVHVEGIEVVAGRILDGVRIEVPPFGRVKIRLTGFDEEEMPMYSFKRKSETGGFSGGFGNIREKTICLEPGSWEGRFRLEGGETIKRSIQVVLDETTEYVISREEFGGAPQKFAMVGSILYSDGTPVADAALTFFPWDLFRFSRDVDEIKCKSDADGNFTADGFMPGEWGVDIHIPGQGGSGHLQDFAIFNDSPNPFNYKGVVHRGRVHGVLYPDPEIANVLGGSGIRFQARLHAVTTDKDAGAVGWSGSTSDGGQSFGLSFCSPGVYTLRAYAAVHKKYESAPFNLEDGQTVDLGSITLERIGCVILEVVDTKGDPVEIPIVTFPGIKLVHEHGSNLTPNKCYYHNDRLPGGPVNVRVSARGYKEKNLTFTKTPGEIKVVKVVLDAE